MHERKLEKFNRYDALFQILSLKIPEERLIRDPLRTLAYGTDASFYRLTPKLVVRVQSEDEVAVTIRACAQLEIPYTFRAAGTSLSGQALSDSVLIQLSRLWNGIHVNDDGTVVRLEPAVLGSEANRSLARFKRKIGPDPASLDSAMIAGIAANNASGMCCGNVHDTYHTMLSVRIVFSDGSVLDTASPQSRQSFLAEHGELIRKIDALARRVKQSTTLCRRIRHKYRIKNTTGYSLQALVDFDDPLDIIAHLLIGSEGTLGFISEITYRTMPDPPFHATGMVLFPDIRTACNAAHRLGNRPVAAVELMDRQSLRSVEDKPGVPKYFSTLRAEVTALLVELQPTSAATLQEHIRDVSQALEECRPLEVPGFTQDKTQSKRLWDIRKGLFPSLGFARQKGTTIIIEDVAFPLERLADAALDLRHLFERHGYRDAVIFGHALQGNLHFVFCADFNRDAEVRRYAAFLEDLTRLVTEKYDGSLKAEHGTGRNMAPFVEREWGTEAYEIMREIKQIFDPRHLLNPGVILTDDPRLHVSNLKTIPSSHPIIEKCTECGFCERTCPSQNLSLSPRQRIAAWREISEWTAKAGELRKEDRNRLKRMRQDFDYLGDQTCAVDGLCATLCPVGIDTGAFIKELRRSRHSTLAQTLGNAAAAHLDLLLAVSRTLLRTAGAAHSVLGTSSMNRLTDVLRKVSRNALPAWNPWVPRPSSHTVPFTRLVGKEKVVYFPCCVSRLFGASTGSPYSDSQNARIEGLLRKAGYSAIYPNGLENLCCGMAFSSKGYPSQANRKMNELVDALSVSSQQGDYPVLIDASPCAQRLKEYQVANPNLRIYDIADFLMDFVAPRVHMKKRPGRVAVHVPCSLRRSAQEKSLISLAEMCSEKVCIPESVACCGFAGDRGFSNPELTASALVRLPTALPSDCQTGYSSSRTCEIGVSLHSGISYQSIAYLVDEAVQTVDSS